MRTHRTFVLLGVALAMLAVACYDGPFAHTNPNDPAVQFTMRLESDRDTISPGDPEAQFTLVTEPAMPGYQPLWTVTNDTLVTHEANGLFTLFDVPEFPLTVTVTARFMNKSTTRTLVIAPTP